MKHRKEKTFALERNSFTQMASETLTSQAMKHPIFGPYRCVSYRKTHTSAHQFMTSDITIQIPTPAVGIHQVRCGRVR